MPGDIFCGAQQPTAQVLQDNRDRERTYPGVLNDWQQVTDIYEFVKGAVEHEEG